MREIPFCFQSIFVSGQIILCNSTVKWQTSFDFGSYFTSGEQQKEMVGRTRATKNMCAYTSIQFKIN